MKKTSLDSSWIFWGYVGIIYGQKQYQVYTYVYTIQQQTRGKGITPTLLLLPPLLLLLLLPTTLLLPYYYYSYNYLYCHCYRSCCCSYYYYHYSTTYYYNNYYYDFAGCTPRQKGWRERGGKMRLCGSCPLRLRAAESVRLDNLQGTRYDTFLQVPRS